MSLFSKVNRAINRATGSADRATSRLGDRYSDPSNIGRDLASGAIGFYSAAVYPFYLASNLQAGHSFADSEYRAEQATKDPATYYESDDNRNSSAITAATVVAAVAGGAAAAAYGGTAAAGGSALYTTAAVPASGLSVAGGALAAGSLAAYSANAAIASQASGPSTDVGNTPTTNTGNDPLQEQQFQRFRRAARLLGRAGTIKYKGTQSLGGDDVGLGTSLSLTGT